MNFLTKFSIQKKIRIIFITFGVISLFVAVLFYYFLDYFFSINELNALVHKTNAEIQLLQNNENKLFAKLQNNEIIKSDDETYLSIDQSINKLNPLFEKIISYNNQKSLGIINLVKITNTNYLNYLSIIEKIKEITKQRMNTSFGFYADFVNSEKRLLETLNNFPKEHPFQKQFDLCNQAAFKFRLEKDEIYYSLFIRRLDSLIVLVKNQPASGNVDIYLKTKLIDNLHEYEDVYNLIITQNIILGLKTNEGYIGKADENLELIKYNLNEILASINQTNSDNKKYSILIIETILILFTLLFIAIFYVMFRSITHSVKEIQNYLDKLILGLLPDKIIPQAKGEIEQIINSLNIIVSGLYHKVRFAKQIGEGNLENDFTPLSDKDILGNSLIDMKNRLVAAKNDENARKKEDDMQDWITTGLAQFGDVMRQNTDNLKTLTIEIIKNLIEYLNANQGALFIYNNENPEDVYLDLVAAFAYDRQKFLDKKIKLSEGLIGACAVEKIVYHFDTVPDDYIKISSGFGNTKPKSLLIVPLLINKEIMGVVELASLNVFEKHHIEFITKLSEDIATTISYVKINMRTAQLLEKTQKQKEEMILKENQMQEIINQATLQQKQLEEKSKNLEKKVTQLEFEKRDLEQKIIFLRNTKITES